jgi:3-hydroxypropanoate dehydrogenase
MSPSLDDNALGRLFRSARSIHTFIAEPVTDVTLHQLYELLKWGPTAFNAQPGRYVFIRSVEGKARLVPALSEANREKTRAAPVTVIVAYDTKFYEHLPDQFPNSRAVELLSGNALLSEATANRNGTLQGGYLLIAARALGLAVGPMSGFNSEAVNREFFPDGRLRANFLVNLGYSDASTQRPRGPRLEFADVAEVL